MASDKIMSEKIEKLIEFATNVRGKFTLSGEDYDAGAVGSAIMTTKGNIYTGICIDLACGIGFCAEHAAIAEMLKHRETDISLVVAVGKRKILPPCGRCREMMMQISEKNKNTIVILSETKTIKLSELLPYYWDE